MHSIIPQMQEMRFVIPTDALHQPHKVQEMISLIPSRVQSLRGCKHPAAVECKWGVTRYGTAPSLQVALLRPSIHCNSRLLSAQCAAQCWHQHLQSTPDPPRALCSLRASERQKQVSPFRATNCLLASSSNLRRPQSHTSSSAAPRSLSPWRPLSGLGW